MLCNLSLFFVSIFLIVAKGEDKCDGYWQDKLLINGKYYNEHVLYIDYGSTVEFYFETCNKTIAKPKTNEWQLADASGTRKTEFLDYSTNLTIHNVTYKHSGYLKVHHSNMYAYLGLKICPQIGFIVEHLLVDCTIRSSGRYALDMTCTTNHTAYYGDDCKVEISNFTIGHAGKFAKKRNSCTSKLCAFNLCQNQDCHFLLEPEKHQFEISYDVVIYGEKIRARENVRKTLALYEIYEPSLNINTIEVMTGGTINIGLEGSEFFGVMKNCNFEVDIIDSESQITIDNTELKIVISNLEPNTKYILRVRIRSVCNGKYGKWSTDRIIAKTTKPTKPKTKLTLEMTRISDQKLALLIHDQPDGEKFGSGFNLNITINNSTIIGIKNRFMIVPKKMLSNEELQVQATCQNDIGPCENIAKKRFLIGEELNIYTTTAFHQFQNGLWTTTFLWHPNIPKLKQVRVIYCKSKQPFLDCDFDQFVVESLSTRNPVIQNSNPTFKYAISFCFESGCLPMTDVTYSQTNEDKPPKVNLDAHHNSRDSTMTVTWVAPDFGLIKSFLVEVRTDDKIETIKEIPKGTTSSTIHQYTIKIICDKYQKYDRPQFTVSTVTSFLGHKTVGEPAYVYQNCWVNQKSSQTPPIIIGVVITLIVVGVGIIAFCCAGKLKDNNNLNNNSPWFGCCRPKSHKPSTPTDFQLNCGTQNGQELVPLTSTISPIVVSYPRNSNNNNGTSASGVNQRSTFNGNMPPQNSAIPPQLFDTSSNRMIGRPNQDQIRPAIPTESPPEIPTAHLSSMGGDVYDKYDYVEHDPCSKESETNSPRQMTLRIPEVTDNDPDAQQPLLESISCESPSSIRSISSENSSVTGINSPITWKTAEPGIYCLTDQEIRPYFDDGKD